MAGARQNMRVRIPSIHQLCVSATIIGASERALPLMMSTALARPRTSRRLRMRDIHVIYADSNSADCWFYTRTRSRSPPNVLHFIYNSGERERAPPLMMSTALASVRPSSYVSQTAHARYSRDICGFEFC